MNKDSNAKVEAEARARILLGLIKSAMSEETFQTIDKYASLWETVKIRCYLTHESDRGIIILAAAHIDGCLKDIFRASMLNRPKLFEELTSGNGPLSSFSSRTKMAYMYGHIGKKCLNMLNGIRGIRNKCAHLTEFYDFSDDEIKQQVDAIWSNIGGKTKMNSRQKFIKSFLYCVAQINYAVKFADPVTEAKDTNFNIIPDINDEK